MVSGRELLYARCRGCPTTPEEKRAHRKAVILKTIRHPCIVAEKYNGDSAFASKCVAVSTALSLITTPLWCLVA